MTAQELAAKDKQEVQGEERTRPGRFYLPDVDIYEDDTGLSLLADMPGVDQSSVSVDLHEDTLTIQGEVGLAHYEGLTPVYTEYNVGHFSRRFALPESAQFDRNKITARISNGVLQIRLPKAERAQPRRIRIQG
jgi:HSP20 family molecular chaperone IbpA